MSRAVAPKKARSLPGVALAVVLTVLAPVARADGFTLQGRAYEMPTGKGFLALTIRLVPPKASKLPDYVTTTAEDGPYRLEGVPAGRYLLEAKQGATLVFRRTITLDHDATEDIGLKVQPKAP